VDRGVLLSHVTQELIRDELPRDLELRDLGIHRLQDLTYPEHIFQVLLEFDQQSSAIDQQAGDPAHDRAVDANVLEILADLQLDLL
jgi:hypothetical protein